MDWKICQYKPCGKIFYKNSHNAGTWHRKETCNVRCSDLLTNAKRTEQRKRQRDIERKIDEQMKPVQTATEVHYWPVFRWKSVTDKWLYGYVP